MKAMNMYEKNCCVPINIFDYLAYDNYSMEVVYKIFIDNKCAGSIYGADYYCDKKVFFDQGFTQFETLSREIKKSTGKITILRMGDEYVEAVPSYEDFKKWVGENYKSYVGACK